MKPTHAQLVNLLREIVGASPQVQPWLIERARQVLRLRDDAPVTPAVTGEAAQLAETLRELANNFGSGNPTFNGFKAGHDSNRQRAYAACLAGADALAPPPTCGTCRWLRHVGANEDDTEPACAHESEAHPLHWCRPVGNSETFGCTFHEPTEPTR